MKLLTRRLEKLDGYDRSNKILAKLIDIKLQINMEMEKEKKYWQQWPRVNWLKMGDKNTFFSIIMHLNEDTRIKYEDYIKKTEY